MSTIKQHWKLFLSLFLLLLGILLFCIFYLPDQISYQQKKKQLTNSVTSLQDLLTENKKYSDIRPLLADELAAIEASREDLYKQFPAGLSEEVLNTYVQQLEQLFGTEMNVSVGDLETVTTLSDGTSVNSRTLTINYKSSYADFKNMLNYLSTDSRVISVQTTDLDYDKATDIVKGTVTIVLYSLNIEKQ